MIVIRSPRARRAWCILSLLAVCAVATSPVGTRADVRGSGHDLSIQLESNEPMVPTGGEFTITMTVQNLGPLAAAVVTVDSSTPPGTT